MDNKEEQNIGNLTNSNKNKETKISINEKEKNIYPFSERINFKYNFEKNLDIDFSDENLLIAKNKNCLVFYTDEDCISNSGISSFLLYLCWIN